MPCQKINYISNIAIYHVEKLIYTQVGGRVVRMLAFQSMNPEFESQLDRFIMVLALDVIDMVSITISVVTEKFEILA